MKKIFLITSLLFAATFAAKAQSGYLISTTNLTTLDTVTNTGVRLQKLPIGGYQDVVSIQTLLVSKTGTPAGVVRLYASDNGVTFVRINATDSLVVNANALSKIWVVPVHAYTYYEAGFTGSGTQVTTLQDFAIWRKR